MLNRIVKAVKNELPRFNDDLIINLRKREFDGLIDFVAARFRECAQFADPMLILEDYYVLPPKERLIEELEHGIKKNTVNIRDDESVLVRYNFKYYDQEFYVTLYVPYLYQNSSVIVNGTNYECQLSMTEKLFSIRTNANGLTIKVVRAPIACYMDTLYSYVDEVTGQQFVGSIVSCSIHVKSAPKSKKIKPTIYHYLLCKFTIPELLTRFNIDTNSIYFVEKEEWDDNFFYFKTKGHTSNPSGIYLKVHKETMQTNQTLHDIVSAILYFMSSQRFVLFDELVHDSKRVFLTILGKLIYSSNTDRIHALNYMIKHIESTDSYLDDYTREIFRANGIVVNDIYDMLCFVVEKINWIIVNFPNNNMYNKRVETINHVVTDNVIRFLNLRIYKMEKKPGIDHMFKTSKRVFRVPPRAILKSLGRSDSVRFRPSINSDNWLLSVGSKVVKRLSAATKSSSPKKTRSHGSSINAPVNKFHPSMLVIESAIGFSSKPGSNCLINPYAQIDENGGFVRDEFAEQTSIIAKNMVSVNSL